MKKHFIYLLFFLCFALCQCSKKQTQESESVSPAIPMWLFNSSSTTQQIKEKLVEDRIFDEEREFSTDKKNFILFSSSKYVIDYLGIDWNDYAVGTLNDTIATVCFIRLDHSDKDFYESSVQSLVGRLDDLYGQHRQKNVEKDGMIDGNSRSWDWVKDGVSIELYSTSAVKKNDVLMLGFTKGEESVLMDLIDQLPR